MPNLMQLYLKYVALKWPLFPHCTYSIHFRRFFWELVFPHLEDSLCAAFTRFFFQIHLSGILLWLFGIFTKGKSLTLWRTCFMICVGSKQIVPRMSLSVTSYEFVIQGWHTNVDFPKGKVEIFMHSFYEWFASDLCSKNREEFIFFILPHLC